MAKNQGYKINYTNNTVTMTKKFAAEASEYGTAAYNLLMDMRDKKFNIVVRESTPRKACPMYIPKPGYEQPQHEKWSSAFPFEGASYVDKADLKEGYKLYQHYPHHCPKCKKRMQALSTDEFEKRLNNKELKCPICKSQLELQDIIMWD